MSDQEAIQTVLQRISPTWEEFDPSELSERETAALNWLNEVGVVEERLNWIFTAPDTEGRLICRFRFTGATERDIWTEASISSRDWVGWQKEPQRQDVAPSYWRLTQYGENAKPDILADVATIGRIDLWVTREPRTLPSHVKIEVCEIERTADNEADNEKKFHSAVPQNPDVAKLAKKIKKEYPKNGTYTDIAREFTNGNAAKAESLLRSLRRFPDLLK